MHSPNWQTIYYTLGHKLTHHAEPVEVGEWQSQDVKDRPEMVTRELLNVSFQFRVPRSDEELRELVEPNMPWAEDHFQERVSGKPLNPPPSEAWWPFAVKGNEAHKEGEVFSHTYPERMWPRFANAGGVTLEGRQVLVPHVGIRFEYGDLMDVVELLRRSPMTRQAYLPIWFPEDTGNVHGVRVPCTLGYHFIVRMGRLDVTYYIRSCDYLRHFSDDVYMAGRLLQWMNEMAFGWGQDEVPSVEVGTLTMHITSLHIFEGDMPRMRTQYQVGHASQS